jgi:hypothetical protein
VLFMVLEFWEGGFVNRGLALFRNVIERIQSS